MVVCPSVCLSLRQDISRTTRATFTNFFVHVAYIHGSVLLRHIYDRPHCLSPGIDFLPHWQCNTMHSLQKGSLDRQERHAAQGIIPSLPHSLKMGSSGKGVTGVHTAGEVYLRLPCSGWCHCEWTYACSSYPENLTKFLLCGKMQPLLDCMYDYTCSFSFSLFYTVRRCCRQTWIKLIHLACFS